MDFQKFVIVLLLALETKAIPVEDDLTITSKEKYALNEFKKQILQLLPNEVMKTDIYLIKWLRASNLDLSSTKEKLLSNLKWRERNRMDSITEEDFSRFEQDFPVSLDGRDFTGRPIAALDASQWDVRKAVMSGKRDELERYTYRMMEISSRKVYEAQKRGENVTQGTTLINLKGFNLIQHGCLSCISIYINIVLAYENFYPGMVHKIVTINTPASFEVVLASVKPVMSKDTKNALTVFGPNKQEWLRYLLNMIPLDQLDRSFGGNKIT